MLPSASILRRAALAAVFFVFVALPAHAQSGSICSGDTGSVLRSCLRGAYTPTNPRGYGPARDILYGSIDVTAANELEAVYTGYTITLDPNADPSSDAFNKGINTEHVTPRSQGAENFPQEGDMHNLRPTRENVNSSRGSLPFAEIPDASTDDWYAFSTQQSTTPDASDPYSIDAYSERDVNVAFEPRESVKGDIARAVFYFAAIHENAVDRSFIQEQLADLQQWHDDDPVTQAEIDRSSAIAAAQGNENPFVLDATLADRAFQDGFVEGSGDGGTSGTIADARTAAGGTSVSFTGIVTRAQGQFVYLQDESGPTGASAFTIRQESGAFFDDVAAGTIAPGTELEVTGIKSYFAGLQQINTSDLTNYTVVSQGNALPAPQVVSLETLRSSGEEYEAELIEVAGVQVVNTTDATFAAGTTYDVSGPTQSDPSTVSDPITFRIPNESNSDVDGTDVPTAAFTFTGVLGQFHGFDFESLPDAGYQLLAIQPSTALPVELTIFTVQQVRDGALLEWETASETGNAAFEVQHRAPGDRFRRVGRVGGAGTTDRPTRYRFETGGLVPGMHAFRLRQVDVDGTATLSGERTLTVRSSGGLTVHGANPLRAGQAARVTIAVPTAQRVTLTAYNVLGQRVATVYSGSAAPGQSVRATFPADRVASGTYFLRLTGETVAETRRVTVVR